MFFLYVKNHFTVIVYSQRLDEYWSLSRRTTYNRPIHHTTPRMPTQQSMDILAFGFREVEAFDESATTLGSPAQFLWVS